MSGNAWRSSQRDRGDRSQPRLTSQVEIRLEPPRGPARYDHVREAVAVHIARARDAPAELVACAERAEHGRRGRTRESARAAEVHDDAVVRPDHQIREPIAV